ncbi:hypothetical protein B0E55_05833 [Rhodococcus sp. 66b]|nr:hypothetical protein B0E55_05833 [Rhodococcus sp. 66b]
MPPETSFVLLGLVVSSGCRHERGQLRWERVLAGCVRGGFDDCGLSVPVDANDPEYRDAFGPDSQSVALLHGILLYRDAGDWLFSQLPVGDVSPVSFDDVEVKGFARFAGFAAIGVDR